MQRVRRDGRSRHEGGGSNWVERRQLGGGADGIKRRQRRQRRPVMVMAVELLRVAQQIYIDAAQRVTPTQRRR